MITFGDIKVRASTALPKVSVVPAKVHKLNRRYVPRHDRYKTYHDRIQKKWNKRFGTRDELFFVGMMDTIYTHPDNVEILKRKVKDGGLQLHL